jgi:gamma-D-glutamyl-L-lysine dipeptidyl-peptidase
VNAEEQLESRLRAVAAAAGRDPRALFLRLRPAGAGWVVQASDAELLPRLLAALHADAPGCELQAQALPAGALGDRVAWVAASVADVRRLPRHDSEQVTQALQGELLTPLLHEEGWLLGRLPDGYIGWIRDWHVRLVEPAQPRQFLSRADARIASPLVRLREAPAPEATPLAESPLGTLVARHAQSRGWAEVELPARGRGWVRDDELRPGTGPWPATAPALLATLRAFLGVPYVWGGKSPKGFDCSGLVQFVFGLHGVTLARDSDQQFDCGEPVEVQAPGDLLFFGRERITHVGVAVDSSEFLHARGEVRRNALDPDSPIHDAELAALLRGRRRLLPQPD